MVVRLGVIGIGKIARTRGLPAAVQVPGVRVTALGSRRPAELATQGLLLPPQVRVLDYASLVAAGRDLIDAVYIALPNDMHVEWIERCAAAGLHVLCEKPLSVDAAAARQATDACAAARVLLTEAFMYRFDPRHQRVRQLIADGRIGEVRHCRAHFSYPLDDLGNIRLRVDRHGGALTDVGCYGIDMVRFVLGVEPLTVTARCQYGAASGVDELTVVDMRCTGGVEAVIVASTLLARRHEYQIFGSRGAILVPNAFVPRDHEPTEIIIESDAGRIIEPFPPFAPFIAEITHFAATLAAPVPTLTPPAEDGVANAAVLDAVRQALRLGGTVEISRHSSRGDG